ncbi:ABC transporter substrate-binding protein [Candidatus Frankia alpina]|uniref:ABC transporter substrate-binding protein n=1 Tax=Candidatus Frankia alpina TaxID=2699483 RepID=UPI001F2EF7E2|nr:ABC transporter substrate-binding protein [Candidatus Frankia alpina]
MDLRSQPCSRSSVVAAVLGCVLLAGVAACGSRRDDRAGTVNTACATAAPGVTQDGINLGLLYSGSGFGSDPSTLFRAGIDARPDEQNAKGGMNGRKITYSFRDDESVPELNLVAGRDLAEHGNVLSILQFSVAPSGSAALLEQQGVPAVEGVIPDPGEHRNVFGYSRPLSQLPVSSGWGEFIAAKGGKRAVTISVELSAATTTLAGISAQSLRAAGVDVVTNLQVPAGAFDAARFAQQLRAAGADSLIAFVPAQTYYQIVAGARAAGVNLTVALGNLATYDRSALDLVGAAAAGAYSFLDYAPFELNTAAHRRFLAAMAAYSPQAASVPDGSTLIGWITTDLLLEGIKAAGLCPTRASVLTGLRAQTHYDAGGLLPAPIDLSKGMGNIAPCYDYVQVNKAGTGFDPVAPAPGCGHVLPASG